MQDDTHYRHISLFLSLRALRRDSYEPDNSQLRSLFLHHSFQLPEHMNDWRGSFATVLFLDGTESLPNIRSSHGTHLFLRLDV